MAEIKIIGAGLAGSEAAWQAAQLEVEIVLHEMRPVPVRALLVRATGPRRRT